MVAHLLTKDIYFPVASINNKLMRIFFSTFFPQYERNSFEISPIDNLKNKSVVEGSTHFDMSFKIYYETNYTLEGSYLHFLYILVLRFPSLLVLH